MSLIDQITPVVVTYNSAELYDRLFETLSIFKQFIIVDNDSDKSDDLILRLKKSFPNQLYISSKNIGYGPGNNLGMIDNRL